MSPTESPVEDTPNREIRLIKNPDGQWTAREVHVEVTAQGETRLKALDNLDAVIEAVENDGGREPTEAEMRALGVESDTEESDGDDFPGMFQ